MSFWGFLSKAVEFAGDVIGEAIDTGPLTINKKYLDSVSELRLEGYQRQLVTIAIDLNRKAFELKKKQSSVSIELKDLKEKKKSEITTILNASSKELISLAKEISPDSSISNGQVDDFISNLVLDVKKEEYKENIIKFRELREEYFDFKSSTAELSDSLDMKISEHESLLKQHKSEYSVFFPKLRGAMMDVKAFGDQKLKEHRELQARRR